MINTYDNSIKPLAVVTCASTGLGYELARQFAKNGFDLIVVAENPSIVEIAEELKDYGVDAISFQLDLATHEGVDILYKKIVSMGRPVEVLGISQLKSDSFSYLSKCLLKDMISTGKGHMFFNSTKEDQFLKALRQEITGTNVTITTLAGDAVSAEDGLLTLAQDSFNATVAGADHIVVGSVKNISEAFLKKKLKSQRDSSFSKEEF